MAILLDHLNGTRGINLEHSCSRLATIDADQIVFPRSRRSHSPRRKPESGRVRLVGFGALVGISSAGRAGLAVRACVSPLPQSTGSHGIQELHPFTVPKEFSLFGEGHRDAAAEAIHADRAAALAQTPPACAIPRVSVSSPPAVRRLASLVSDGHRRTDATDRSGSSTTSSPDMFLPGACGELEYQPA
jgi:hypothetical protein